MRLTRNRWSVLFLLLFGGCAAAQDLFDIKPVADGVYAAIAKPAYKTNCNAAIILLGDSVLVVDTHSKPSAARGLIAQIKTLTDKPVKYVVNTHFHWDHCQGNQAIRVRGQRELKSSPPKQLAKASSSVAFLA